MDLPTIEQLAATIDHSVLKPTQSSADLALACAMARAEHVASVCVKPAYVAACRRLLEGSDVMISTVVAFPHGGDSAAAKVAAAARALDDGADELDMVVNIGALLDGDHAAVRNEIEMVVAVARPRMAPLKVIVECVYLDREQKLEAAYLALAAGASFVKTSTGFAPGGATVEDVQLIRGVVGSAIGVKAAGGIRTLDHALALLNAGASRLGTSATPEILGELRLRRAGDVRATP